MKHEFAGRWRERLLVLQTQLEREPASALAWHWRAEAKVLRFLLRRYGKCEARGDAATPAVAASQPTELSPLERTLSRMALVIPNVATKHPRPAPCERAAILARIKCVRDEARAIEATDESWLAELNCQLEAVAYSGIEARRNALRLRERQEELAN